MIDWFFALLFQTDIIKISLESDAARTPPRLVGGRSSCRAPGTDGSPNRCTLTGGRGAYCQRKRMNANERWLRH